METGAFFIRGTGLAKGHGRGAAVLRPYENRLRDKVCLFCKMHPMETTKVSNHQTTRTIACMSNPALNTLTPHAFVAKWRANRAKERSAAQEHFIDLCRMLGEPTPNDVNTANPDGERYAFEKGANKQLGGPIAKQGWADVWKHGCFAFEYKGKHADLNKAYQQLQQYRESLLNPPLLVTCDLERIIIHTNFTNTVKRVIEIGLDDIEANDWVSLQRSERPERLPGLRPLDVLKLIFREYKPDEHPLRSDKTTEAVTQAAAQLFGEIATAMRSYNEGTPQAIAHFLIRVLFCLFAEDVSLLPRSLFREMIDASKVQPKRLAQRLRELFAAMRSGGTFGNYDIPHFNGGLFDGDEVLEIDSNAMLSLRTVSDLDWSAVEPSIFGTLFERGLDPGKRAQLGAHYTSRSDIELIVEPVLMQPLRREWQAVRAEALALAASLPLPRAGEGSDDMGHRRGGGLSKQDNQTLAEINALVIGFRDKLAATKVLDPACGSGNFLYVALRALLTLEKEVIALNNELGLPRISAPKVSPAQLFGLEVNEYAHELAQATVWIGYIQWRNENGFGPPAEPILRKLDNIQRMDAIMVRDIPLQTSGVLTQDAATPAKRDKTPEVLACEPDWPEADVIVGNPPFLGDKKMRSELGDDYVEALRALYKGRIPGQSDLVCYWFEKARAQIEMGKAKRAGLIATQGIRGGKNRVVLERIKASGDIFVAWRDRNWFLDGATVHVSVIGFDDGSENGRVLDDQIVSEINPDLTTVANVASASTLKENNNLSFIGPSPHGPFDIEDEVARQMLNAPLNVNGKSNVDVIRPVVSSIDIGQGSRRMWTIDFGLRSLEEASEYEAPFEYAKRHIQPFRAKNSRANNTLQWWQYERPRREMRDALFGLMRYIASPRVSKHRLFIWLDASILANDGTVVIARTDDYFFGVLHSRVHELWARRTGTQLREAESGFRYTPSTCIETFPFPWPPGQEPSRQHSSAATSTEPEKQEQAIAAAARELVQKRDRWLAEAPSAAGEAIDPAYLAGLNAIKKKPKKTEARTLTNLYNQRPTWLELVHKKLDATVFAAYGWPTDLTDEQILENLLALNLARATAS